jgi:hypothetical protein
MVDENKQKMLPTKNKQVSLCGCVRFFNQIIYNLKPDPTSAGSRLLKQQQQRSPSGRTQLNCANARFTFHANQVPVVGSFDNVGRTLVELNRADASCCAFKRCSVSHFIDCRPHKKHSEIN